MRTKNKFTEDGVIRSLSKKKVVFNHNKTMDLSKAQELGNGPWAKIGFMKYVMGWIVLGQRAYSHPPEAETAKIIIGNPLITNQRRIIC